MFFLAGITGQVGGAAARQLLRQGRPVRALARDRNKAAAWSQQGVEVRQGDLHDAAAVASALQGVEAAFVMVPPCIAPAPGYPESKAIIAALREALRQAPPPRLVVLSSIGSEKTSGLGLITATHLLEEALSGVPCPTAFIRAGSFFENYVPALGPAAATGVFYSFLQPTDRPVPMIATEDIGIEVARLLTESRSWSGNGKRIVELGTAVSADELARAMGEVLGRPVQAQAIPRERWSATCESFGMPAGASWAYEEMLDGINSGWIEFGAPGAERVPGKRTPAEVFAQAKRSSSGEGA